MGLRGFDGFEGFGVETCCNKWFPQSHAKVSAKSRQVRLCETLRELISLKTFMSLNCVVVKRALALAPFVEMFDQ